MNVYAVECIIYNNKKEVLLQKKTLDAPIFASHWLLFGGGIDDINEHPDDAIARELKEELDIDVKPKLYKVNFIDNGQVLFTYEVEYSDSSKFKLTEGGGFSYFDIKELNTIKLPKRIVDLLKDWRAYERS